jgi:hypothetical protein
MITVPFVLRRFSVPRFFGSIDDGCDVNKLLERLLEMALFASAMSSQRIDIAAVLGSLPAPRLAHYP